MSYCPQTDGNLAALAVYEREQAKLDISEREFERAKVSALLRILKRDQGAANDYTGLELVSEAICEHTTNYFRPICSLLADAAKDCDTFRQFEAEIDDAELGRLVKSLMLPYLESVAETRAAEEVASDESDRADYERDARRDEDVERAA